MALSYVGGNGANQPTVTLPTFAAGDIAIVFAFNGGNNTPPTLPTGWTNIASSGANSHSSRIGYRVLQTGDTSTGTWTTATHIQVMVLRGQRATSPIGVNIGQGGAANTNTPIYTHFTLTSPGSSWVAAFAGHGQATDVNTKNITGWTTRSVSVTALGMHTKELPPDNNTDATYPAVNQTAAWRSYAVEVIAAAGATSTGTAQISLAAAQVPATRTNHVLTVRARKTNAAHTGTLRAQLYEGTTARSAVLETSALTTSLASYDLAIADADAATIGTYSNLEVRLTGYSSAGSPLVVEVAEISLSLPTPSVGTHFGTVVLPLSLTSSTTGTVTSSGAKTTGSADVSLTTGFVPTSRTNHVITIRARRTALQGKLRVQLVDGNGTPRGAELETGELTTSLANYTLSLPDADAATIVDYSNLSLKIRGYSSTGTATVFEVAEVSMSLPAAGSGSGGTVLGQVTLSSIATIAVGASAGVDIYPGGGIYPHALITLAATGTISAAAGTNSVFGQVVLPLTLTRVTSGFGNINNSGQVLLASTATISVTPIAAIQRFGAASVDSVATITVGGGAFDQVGALTLSATGTITVAGVVPGAVAPADYVDVGLDHLPDLLVAVAFPSQPLDPLQSYTGVSGYSRAINTRRGRQFELDRVETGQGGFLLDNRDGRFSPLNTSSPYYPNLKPLRRLRFALRWAGVEYEIFHGFLQGFPQEFPSYGLDSIVRQSAVDAFVILALDKITPGSTVTSGQINIGPDTFGHPQDLFHVASTALPMPQAVPFEIEVSDQTLNVTEIVDSNTYRVEVVGGGTLGSSIGPLQFAPGVAVTTKVMSFAEETTGTRIQNVLRASGLNPSQWDLDTGASLMAASEDLAGQSPLEHCLLAAEMEQGRFFASRAGLITFRDRWFHYRTETSSRATFGDSTGELPYRELQITHEDEKIWNVVRITTPSGYVAEARDTASIGDYFERVLEKSWPYADDNEADVAASWLLKRFGQMQVRIPSMKVAGGSAPSTLWPVILAMEIGNRYRTIRRPRNDATIDKQVIVESIAHTMSLDNLETTVQMSLADTTAYWRLGTAGHGELGATTVLGF
jgi:hypothetical protein